MKATNLLPTTATPASALVTITPKLTTTYADEVRRHKARQERRKRLVTAMQAAVETPAPVEPAEVEAAAEIVPEPLQTLPEPEGLWPPEPRRFPREPQRLTDHWAKVAETIAANRARFMARERQRLETMASASAVSAIFTAMRAAFETCGIDDESIFDRVTTGTYRRCPEAVKRRRAVFLHMHYHGGVSWSDIARAFGVAHSVVMSSRRPLKGACCGNRSSVLTNESDGV
jgi:DNA-directed RNA polymerase specialized sigma24 family protein